MRGQSNVRPLSHVVLGLTGTADAMSAANLLIAVRSICEQLTVIATPHATRFFALDALRSLGDIRTMSDCDGNLHNHMSLACDAELLLVAPASANTIGKLAHGLADNLLTTFALGHQGHTIVAPSMSSAMWDNPFVKRNIEQLVAQGIDIVEPVSGTEVASLRESFGAVPKPALLCEEVLRLRRRHNARWMEELEASNTGAPEPRRFK